MSKRVSVPLITLLVASWTASAVAQETSDVVAVTVNIDLVAGNVDGGLQLYVVNREDCRSLAAEADDDIRFVWTFTRTPPSDALYTLKLKHGDQTCSTSSLTEETSDECPVDFERRDLSTRTVTENLTFREITTISSEAQCEGLSDTHDVTLIFTSFAADAADDDTDFDQVRFDVRTARPPAPTGLTAAGGESSLRIDWDEVSDADSYDVFYSTDPLEAGTAPEDIVSSMSNTMSDSATIDSGIVANLTYYIAVSTLDDDGNASLLSEVVTVTTQPVTDFYELYRQEGGLDGCATLPARVPGGALAWIVAVAAGIRLRRRWEKG